MLSATEFVLVAAIVTKEFATGVVVPNTDGVVAPTTAPATCANAAEVNCWRGESVSKLLLLEETSTCKYKFGFAEKSKLSASGYPFAVSPMFTVNTPCLTVAETDVGAEAGHTRLPLPTVGFVQMENLKKYAVPVPPSKFPPLSVSRP